MKWQEVRDMGLNLFKKRNRSRTIWIGGGSLGIFSILAFIVLLTGVTSTYTGDIYCEEECISYINITSTYWRICFAEDFKLIQTNPDIPVDVYVPARGAGNWRLFDPTKDCIERKNQYRTLPNRFMIIGHKKASETIKWNIDKFDIDPKWIGTGEDSKLSNRCRTKKEIHYQKQIGNTTSENGTVIAVYEDAIRETCLTTEQVIEIEGMNRTIPDYYCKTLRDTVVCDSKLDGNGDGICTPGESCVNITLDNRIIKTGHIKAKII